VAAGAPEAPITELCSGPPGASGGQKLCGALDPHANAKVGFYFAYNSGASCTGGSKTPTEAEVEGQDIEVSSEVTGLPPGSEYTYCLVATNPSGETFGGPVTFTTPGVRPPEAPITEVCGGPVSPGAVRLCGTLNPHASARTGYYFAYNAGASCTGGSRTPAGEEAEGQSVEVSSEIVGLEPGTEYAYCLVATSISGEASGQTVTVTTEPQRPAILSETTSAITPTGATLEAQVNPDDQETSAFFEYGTDESLSVATDVPGDNLAAGFGAQLVGVPLGGGLEPSTTYYYRAVAANPSGTSEGPIRLFVTPAAVQQTPPAGGLVSPEGPKGATTPTVTVTAVTGTSPGKHSPPLTRAQKLANALKSCEKQPKRRRPRCEALARKKYGSRPKKTKRG